SLANARDLGEWIGASSHTIFNFPPSTRPLDTDIHIQSFSIPHFPSLMIAMSKLAYLAIAEYSPVKPVVIFIPGRQQCRLTAEDLLAHCGADDDEDRYLNVELSDIQPHLDHISNRNLVETLKHGIGFITRHLVNKISTSLSAFVMLRQLSSAGEREPLMPGRMPVSVYPV
ncbi:hypothetical protein BC826DRAFT_918937, partial [Russula brevipes]